MYGLKEAMTDVLSELSLNKKQKSYNVNDNAHLLFAKANPSVLSKDQFLVESYNCIYYCYEAVGFDFSKLLTGYRCSDKMFALMNVVKRMRGLIEDKVYTYTNEEKDRIKKDLEALFRTVRSDDMIVASSTIEAVGEAIVNKVSLSDYLTRTGLDLTNLDHAYPEFPWIITYGYFDRNISDDTLHICTKKSGKRKVSYSYHAEIDKLKESSSNALLNAQLASNNRNEEEDVEYLHEKEKIDQRIKDRINEVECSYKPESLIMSIYLSNGLYADALDIIDSYNLTESYIYLCFAAYTGILNKVDPRPYLSTKCFKTLAAKASKNKKQTSYDIIDAGYKNMEPEVYMMSKILEAVVYARLSGVSEDTLIKYIEDHGSANPEEWAQTIKKDIFMLEKIM